MLLLRGALPPWPALHRGWRLAVGGVRWPWGRQPEGALCQRGSRDGCRTGADGAPPCRRQRPSPCLGLELATPGPHMLCGGGLLCRRRAGVACPELRHRPHLLGTLFAHPARAAGWLSFPPPADVVRPGVRCGAGQRHHLYLPPQRRLQALCAAGGPPRAAKGAPAAAGRRPHGARAGGSGLAAVWGCVEGSGGSGQAGGHGARGCCAQAADHHASLPLSPIPPPTPRARSSTTCAGRAAPPMPPSSATSTLRLRWGRAPATLLRPPHAVPPPERRTRPHHFQSPAPAGPCQQPHAQRARNVLSWPPGRPAPRFCGALLATSVVRLGGDLRQLAAFECGSSRSGRLRGTSCRFACACACWRVRGV